MMRTWCSCSMVMSCLQRERDFSLLRTPDSTASSGTYGKQMYGKLEMRNDTNDSRGTEARDYQQSDVVLSRGASIALKTLIVATIYRMSMKLHFKLLVGATFVVASILSWLPVLTSTPPNELALVPMLAKQQPQCRISSRGSDGVGHQLEAKLSCIATAAALDDLQYVHSPMTSAEHATNPFEFEDFLGLQKSYQGLEAVHDAVLVDGNPLIRERSPLPRVGTCREASWFNADRRIPQCRNATPGTVFLADNCWDFFYCSLKRGDNVTEMQKVLDVLSKGYATRHHGFSRLTAVVHIRRADSRKRQSSGTFYTRLIQELVDAADQHLQVIVHTDEKNPSRERLLPQLDKKYEVTIRGRAVPLQEVFNDMAQADILVASKSSLSNSAGMMGRQGRPVLYPFDKSRQGLSNLKGWRVLRESGFGFEMFYDWKWGSVDQNFYKEVLVDAGKK